MTLCPIALALGCPKCPIVKICPLKSIVGNFNKNVYNVEIRDKGVEFKRSAPFKVLIVDDDKHIQGLLSAIVKNIGGEAQVAANGPEGYNLASSQEYDLILMDLCMPEVSGMPIIQALGADRPNQKIIVLSGFLDEKIKKDLNKAKNVLTYFHKPFQPEQIRQKIQEVAGG